MILTNDLLLGILIGIAITILMQQALRLGNKLMSPGCLLFIGLGVFIFVVLVLVGILQFQAFS